MADCDSLNTEIERKQCIWLNERKIASCFTRPSHVRDSGTGKINYGEINYLNGKDPSQYCLDRILEDAEYNNINLDADFDYLRDVTKNSTLEKNQEKMEELYSKLHAIQQIKAKNKSMLDTIDAEVELKERFTFSAMAKLLILAGFIILFLTTVIINNDGLYDITFAIIVIILIYNLYIFMK